MSGARTNVLIITLYVVSWREPACVTNIIYEHACHVRGRFPISVKFE